MQVTEIAEQRRKSSSKEDVKLQEIQVIGTEKMVDIAAKRME